jgi:hypothetical protein
MKNTTKLAALIAVLAFMLPLSAASKPAEAEGKDSVVAVSAHRETMRLPKWKSIDPKASNYPSQSPYVMYSNNPIVMVDPRGDADYYNGYGVWIGTNGKPEDTRLYIVTKGALSRSIQEETRSGKTVDLMPGGRDGIVLFPMSDTRDYIAKKRKEMDEAAQLKPPLLFEAGCYEAYNSKTDERRVVPVRDAEKVVAGSGESYTLDMSWAAETWPDGTPKLAYTDSELKNEYVLDIHLHIGYFIDPNTGKKERGFFSPSDGSVNSEADDLGNAKKQIGYGYKGAFILVTPDNGYVYYDGNGKYFSLSSDAVTKFSEIDEARETTSTKATGARKTKTQEKSDKNRQMYEANKQP